MLSCPYCGGVAVIEEYTRIDDEGRHRVRIRRCLSLGRGSSRRRKKTEHLRPVGKCGTVEVLSDERVA